MSRSSARKTRWPNFWPTECSRILTRDQIVQVCFEVPPGCCDIISSICTLCPLRVLLASPRYARCGVLLTIRLQIKTNCGNLRIMNTCDVLVFTINHILTCVSCTHRHIVTRAGRHSIFRKRSKPGLTSADRSFVRFRMCVAAWREDASDLHVIRLYVLVL